MSCRVSTPYVAFQNHALHPNLGEETIIKKKQKVRDYVFPIIKDIRFDK